MQNGGTVILEKKAVASRATVRRGERFEFGDNAIASRADIASWRSAYALA